MTNAYDEINFLDGLETAPPPQFRPSPTAASAPPQTVGGRVGGGVPQFLEFAGIALISAALTAGLVVWRLSPRNVEPRPSADAVALGRTFAPKLAHALAAGFDAGAETLRAGKSIGEADAQLKAAFQAARAKAFDDHAGRAIHDVVPDGQELDNSAQRRALVELFEGFAQGLREAR